MSFNMTYEEFCELTTPKTKEQKEIIELKNKLNEAYENLYKAQGELGKYKKLFELGWKEGENQWRLPREVVLSLLG